MDPDGPDSIFAPWRLSWVTRDGTEDCGSDCVFCAYADPARSDREARVVARSQRAYALVNRAPYNPGHVLVIPREHVGEYVALDEATVTDHAMLVQKTMRALDVALSPDGFNTGMNIGREGGASLDDHLHTHVVPRWVADTNFMPTTANAKVIPQALNETYDCLHEAFGTVDGVQRDGTDEAVSVEN
jgi:ATP adenylyltransferase